MGLEMRDSQCLDADLSFSKDLSGRQRSISVKRSSLFAIISADIDAWCLEEEEVVIVVSQLDFLVAGMVEIENPNSEFMLYSFSLAFFSGRVEKMGVAKVTESLGSKKDILSKSLVNIIFFYKT